MEKRNTILLKHVFACLMLFLGLWTQQGLNAQTCTAPNGCTPTPGFPEAPAALSCGTGFNTAAIFTETFDTGFGVFTEDAAPGGTNDLTLSTAGDTPSAGTGPETTPGCNAGVNDGEFIFLEGSFTLAGEVHCMTANIPIPAVSAYCGRTLLFLFLVPHVWRQHWYVGSIRERYQ